MRQRAGRSVAVCSCVVILWIAGCRDDGGLVVAGDAPTVDDGGDLGLHMTQFLPPGTTIEMAREGRELFRVCSTCHGVDADGTQLGPSLRDQEWLHGEGSFEEIQRVIHEGVDPPREYPIPMPAGGGGNFTEDQVRSIATYVHALSRASAAPALGPPPGVAAPASPGE
jgi:mono/diheme cytochrome c family protein